MPALSSTLPPAAGTQSPAAAIRPRLLLVEDEAIVAMDIADQLGLAGYDIVGIADNGADAIAMARQHRPDLVLMDVVIKGPIDGIETAAQLELDDPVPILFLTAFNDPTTVRRAVVTAPYGYVTKPFQIKELRAAIDVGLYKSAMERRLKVSERWFASTLRCVGDSVIAFDNDGRVRFVNPAAERTLGIEADTIVGRGAEEVLRFRDDPAGQPSLRTDAPEPQLAVARWLDCGSGRCVPVDVSMAPILSDTGAVLGSVCALRDVTSRVEAESVLKRSEERFRTAFDMAPVSMALVAMDGRFLQGNAALLRLLRCSESELVELRMSDVSFAEDEAAEQARLRDLAASRSPFGQFEKRYRTLDGELVWAQASVSLLRRDDMALCYLFQLHEITARKQVEQLLRVQAHADALSGLPNRLSLTEELHRWLERGYRRGRGFAVLYLDLDRFKEANDTHGHQAGDQILRAAAHRMQQALRDTDVIGRWGGDEFIALIDNISSGEDVAIVARKLSAQFEAEFSLGRDVRASIGVSIGVALYPSDGEDSEVLLHRADEALYRAKNEGRGQLRFFADGVNAHQRRHKVQGQELSWALGDMTLRITYPDALSDRADHTPAVLTWVDPSGKTWHESEIRELAASTGLSQRLDAWSLEQACADSVQGIGQQRFERGVSVQVSARTVRSGDLPAQVAAVLTRSGLPADRLCLDVSALHLAHEDDATLRMLADLQETGVCIAVHDVGAYPISLQALVRLSPVRLTFAGDLFATAAPSRVATAVVTTVSAVATALGTALRAPASCGPAWQAVLASHGCTTWPLDGSQISD